MARKIKHVGLLDVQRKAYKRNVKKKISAEDVFKYIDKGMEYLESPLVSSIVQAIGGAMAPSEEDVIAAQKEAQAGPAFTAAQARHKAAAAELAKEKGIAFEEEVVADIEAADAERDAAQAAAIADQEAVQTSAEAMRVMPDPQRMQLREPGVIVGRELKEPPPKPIMPTVQVTPSQEQAARKAADEAWAIVESLTLQGTPKEGATLETVRTKAEADIKAKRLEMKARELERMLASLPPDIEISNFIADTLEAIADTRKGQVAALTPAVAPGMRPSLPAPPTALLTDIVEPIAMPEGMPTKEAVSATVSEPTAAVEPRLPPTPSDARMVADMADPWAAQMPSEVIKGAAPEFPGMPPLTTVTGLPNVAGIAALGLSNQGMEQLRIAGVGDEQRKYFRDLSLIVAEPLPSFEEMYPELAGLTAADRSKRRVMPEILPGTWEGVWQLATTVKDPGEQQRLIAHAKQRLAGRPKNIWEAISSIGGDTGEKAINMQNLIKSFPVEKPVRAIDPWTQRKKEIDIAKAKLDYSLKLDKARRDKVKAEANLYKMHEDILGKQAATSRSGITAAKNARRLLKASSKTYGGAYRGGNAKPLLKNLQKQFNSLSSKTLGESTVADKDASSIEAKIEGHYENMDKIDTGIQSENALLENAQQEYADLVTASKSAGVKYTDPNINTKLAQAASRLAKHKTRINKLNDAKIKTQSNIASAESNLNSKIIMAANKKVEGLTYQNYANEASSILGDKKDQKTKADALLRKIQTESRGR